MKNNKKAFFIPVAGKLIEVSEEIYRAYYRPIWRTRYHAQKSGECICTKAQIWKCDGDCTGCKFCAPGKKVYTDAPLDGEDDTLSVGDTLHSTAPAMDTAFEKTELNHALFEALRQLSPQDRRICELMANHSERKTAAIIGIPRSTFKRRWAKLRAVLQEKLREYYTE